MAAMFFGAGVVVAALAVALLAGAANAYFWWRVNAGALDAQVLGVAMSIMATICKIAIPLWLAVSALQWRARRKLVLVWVLALVFDTWSGVSYVGISRADAAEQRRTLRKDADAATRSLITLRAELASTAETRPSALLPTLVQEQERVAGACPPMRNPSEACATLVKLRVEYATATVREKLHADIAKAERVAGSLPDAADGAQRRPEVAAFAKALASFGLVLPLDTLDTVWAAVLLLLIEVAPVTVLSEVMRRTPPPSPVSAPTFAPTLQVAPLHTPDVPRARVQRPPAGRVDVMPLIQAEPADADGWRKKSQRNLGNRLNTSATTAGRAVEGLVVTGQLERRVSSRGTFVRPLSASAPITLPATP